jgi:leucyl aminopeptidase (aminopeptidase T)
MTALERACAIALRDCLGVRRGESLLVVTDDQLREIGRALLEAARRLTDRTIYVEFPAEGVPGSEPPPGVAEMMARASAVVAPTSRSLTHTEARRAACAAGARVATMPGITEDTLVRCLDADVLRIARRADRVAEVLTRGRVARVTNPAGTDVTLPIEGIRAIASRGLILEPGQFGNLPSGEAYLMPVEGAAQGIVVVDGAMAGLGVIEDEPIRIRVVDGRAVEVSGGAEARRLLALMDRAGPDARNVAELGVGTNDRARITGTILEDEKILGTVHVAFGNNASMGGTVKVPFHLDGVILAPTLVVDGEVLLTEGDPCF